MELKHIPGGGRWLAVNDEVQIGELLYQVKDDVMTISHAEVEAFYRGNKIAEELVLAALHQARANGWKVIPACSFAKTIFERYPEEGDVLL